MRNMLEGVNSAHLGKKSEDFEQLSRGILRNFDDCRRMGQNLANESAWAAAENGAVAHGSPTPHKHTDRIAPGVRDQPFARRPPTAARRIHQFCTCRSEPRAKF